MIRFTCAAHLFVNWLKEPDRYKWAKLEADEFGFLDDIAVVDKDNNLWLKQIKYSCHPELTDNEWTWESLLKELPGKKGPKPSLLKKWFSSWIKEDKNKIYINIFPQLITNRKAGEDLISSTEFSKDPKGRCVNFSKLKKLYPEYFKKTVTSPR